VQWLEQIQQYDFEIIHRKGSSHSNADGLSKRPCKGNNYNYCNKLEFKKREIIGRIIVNSEQIDWRQEEMKNIKLRKILLGKEGNQCPN